MKTAAAILLPDRWTSCQGIHGCLIAGGDFEDPKGPWSAGGTTPAGSKRPGAKRILIVEDEAFAALAARDLLAAEGYDIVGIVANADDAVRKADETRPDLVLMDIRLRGDGDGVAAAIEIRRRFGLPSLFVSALSDPMQEKRAAAARPIGFLAKPYRPEDLLESVRKAIGR